MKNLLIIDDNAEIRKQLKWGLGRDYSILLAGDVTEALSLFKKHRPQVLTLDLGLPPDEEGVTEGFRCLENFLGLAPQTKVIVLTGRGEREHALKALQMGAYDFYAKPVELAELKVMLQRAFHLADLEEANRQLQKDLRGESPGFQGIFGQSPEMLEVFATIRKVATSDVPVLILGESGTGKEMVARALHRESLRRDGPFIPINCGAIPENLLETELFGHEKGAFTGAQARVQGKVEYADKGTLFLDEIGELPTMLQVKLLRFLQDHVIQRVGGRENIRVDTRIVAATNADIGKILESGAFREDLYYRIGVITVSLPPLRRRGDDIMLLATLFKHRYGEAFRKRVRGFSAAALDALRSFDWPGNVRELENRVKRAVIMAEGPILEAEDLGLAAVAGRLSTKATNAAGLTLREAREQLERELLAAALERQEGNIVKAAGDLGVSRPTLYDLLKKHKLYQPTE
ncbi:PEP-CTERM-box response regulator transcription factor [Desulfuromonas sp. TF]|uniref:PEP-CTERM-box response regulator transcription factor n=1 Tax=Desulfuromonas sp. TF TaxID=1232410 RepID=UPI00041576AB|nr:PEP-CTERM-box response regulator transcription factor [Desulfuromonas sp. TF]